MMDNTAIEEAVDSLMEGLSNALNRRPTEDEVMEFIFGTRTDRQRLLNGEDSDAAVPKQE